MGAMHGDLYSPSSPYLELAILWICSKRNSWQSLAMMQRFCNGGGEYLKRRWMRQVARKNMVILKKLSGGGIGDSQFSKDYLGDDGAGDSRGFGDQIKKSRPLQATSCEWTLGMRKQGQGYVIQGQSKGLAGILPPFLGGLTSLDKDSGQMYIVGGYRFVGLTINAIVVSLGSSKMNYQSIL